MEIRDLLKYIHAIWHEVRENRRAPNFRDYLRESLGKASELSPTPSKSMSFDKIPKYNPSFSKS